MNGLPLLHALKGMSSKKDARQRKLRASFRVPGRGCSGEACSWDLRVVATSREKRRTGEEERERERRQEAREENDRGEEDRERGETEERGEEMGGGGGGELEDDEEVATTQLQAAKQPRAPPASDTALSDHAPSPAPSPSDKSLCPKAVELGPILRHNCLGIHFSMSLCVHMVSIGVWHCAVWKGSGRPAHVQTRKHGVPMQTSWCKNGAVLSCRISRKWFQGVWVGSIHHTRLWGCLRKLGPKATVRAVDVATSLTRWLERAV